MPAGITWGQSWCDGEVGRWRDVGADRWRDVDCGETWRDVERGGAGGKLWKEVLQGKN